MSESEKQTKTAPEEESKNEKEAVEANKEQEEEAASPYEKLEADELREILKERDEEIDQLQADLDEARDARLRKAAELDNYRKRVQRERAKIYDTAKANAIEDFLSVSDDLKRTLEASEDMDVNQKFLEGVSLVADKFDEVLSKHGVERIDEEGIPFDVDVHDALMRRKPEDDSVDSDTVLQVVENGYKIGDRTIRHAKVIVSE
ncbi:MAG TPA: nucleotide exchange factor GrpE [Balneolaceae bacterium]|nr:nucleotide exchange factor GrpE [Balneolaceae bacterium]